MSKHPEIAMELLIYLGDQMSSLISELCGTVELEPAERLVRAFHELAEIDGNRCPEGIMIKTPLTVQILADRIGCSRQWTSRLLGELTRQGLVRRSGRAFILVRRSRTPRARTGSRQPPQQSIS